MCHTGMTELCPIGTIGALKGTLGPLSKEQQLAIKSKQARASSALRSMLTLAKDTGEPEH